MRRLRRRPVDRRAANLIRELFETDCDVFFVFNGTAANSLALATCCQSYHSILCHELAHVETDECGAPEFFSNGTKLLLLPGANGKIDPAGIERHGRSSAPTCTSQSRVRSALTQTPPNSGRSTAEEVAAIWRDAKALGLRLHMDGARFANAVASLGCTPKEITWQAGVDVLCFGGTKNGTGVGEAVVFFNRDLAHEFDYRCKQAGQLASKMRFLSAAVGRDAARWRLAAARRPRERDGRAAGDGACRHARGDDPVPAAGQRASSSSLPPPGDRGAARARAGGSTPSSARAAAASCARGTRSRRTWTRSRRTCARPLREFLTRLHKDPIRPV